MKRFLFALSLLLLTLPASAQNNMAPITPLMKKFDANHDGTLDPAERQAMWKALQAKNPALFKRYDTNGDGQITGPEELNAFRMIQQHKNAAAGKPVHHASKPLKPSSSSNPGVQAPEGSDDPPLDKE